MNDRYAPERVKPMWKELEAIGVKSLTTSEEVEDFMKDSKGTSLVFVNSVCGCAAGSARPAMALALQNSVIPDRLGTVFAGVDHDATASARGYMADIQPSSPSVVLFKDGKVVFSLERSDIEQRTDEVIGGDLKAAFDEHCTKEGPSVPWEQVLKVFKVSSM